MGRKLVKETLNNKSVSQINAERFLLGYASSLLRSKLFKRGVVRFSIAETTINLNYIVDGSSICSSQFRYSVSAKNGFDKIVFKAQDFVLNSFYNFERNGKPMKLKDVGAILGMKEQSAQAVVNAIVDKMKQSKALLG